MCTLFSYFTISKYMLKHKQSKQIKITYKFFIDQNMQRIGHKTERNKILVALERVLDAFEISLQTTVRNLL